MRRGDRSPGPWGGRRIQYTNRSLPLSVALPLRSALSGTEVADRGGCRAAGRRIMNGERWRCPMSESVPGLQNYIDGKWQPAKSGATFENRNPATGAVLHEVANSTGADVADAAAAAQAAFPKWRATPAPKR